MWSQQFVSSVRPLLCRLWQSFRLQFLSSRTTNLKISFLMVLCSRFSVQPSLRFVKSCFTTRLDVTKNKSLPTKFQKTTGKKFVKEKKALKLTTTVLFFLVLTYCPVIVIRILIKNTFFDSLIAAHIALAIASYLILLNLLINPVIYCIRRRQFRVAFIEILFRKSNPQAQEIEMQVNGARQGLGWRSQSNEQESVTNSTDSNQNS